MIRRFLFLVGLLAVVGAGCRTAPKEVEFTFVVMGDNRGGDDSGEQPAAFRDLVREVAALRPDCVWNTGDMIYGRTGNLERVRMQWGRYREAIAPLTMPVHHVPGNHDLWDEASGRLYGELWGPTHFVVDRGPVRFIGLDTETAPGRLGKKQMQWLCALLEESAGRRVFIVLHQPLFPVSSHRETSLDAYPVERDELHRIFVAYSDRISAVFAGHEHLYHHANRDGIDYYITGGGGADLHAPPERGGFHHFLLVRVSSQGVRVELHKTGVAHLHDAPPRRVEPGEMLESWENGLVWSRWDYSVSSVRKLEGAAEGTGALQFNVDFSRCGWPVLCTAPGWSAAEPPAAWSLAVFVPPGASPGLAVTPGAEGKTLHEAPPVALRPGWNMVRAVAATNWLPYDERANARSVQWVFTGGDPSWRGSLLLDQFTIEPPARGESGDLEGWESPLVWSTWNESTDTRYVTLGAAHGRRALEVRYDFSECRDPMLIGKAGPALDLSGVAVLEFSVRATSIRPRLSLVLRSGEEDYAAPSLGLQPGWNRLRVSLDGDWLPASARRQVEVLAWRIEPAGSAKDGELVFDEFRAAGAAAAR